MAYHVVSHYVPAAVQSRARSVKVTTRDRNELGSRPCLFSTDHLATIAQIH
jgi:hypothetical protein